MPSLRQATPAKFCSRSIAFSNCFRKRFLLISDIDECHEVTSNCNHYCHNTNGSYFCHCRFGYKLASDNHTCLGKKLRFECVIVESNGLTYSQKAVQDTGQAGQDTTMQWYIDSKLTYCKPKRRKAWIPFSGLEYYISR